MELLDEAASVVSHIRSMNRRKFISRAVNLALIACTAVIIWKGLIIVSGSESPVVVVLSGSMEPAFHRGDILLLWLEKRPFKVGEIVVFRVKDRTIPIVHRVIEVRKDENGKTQLLTKGDNNAVNDRGLYSQQQMWLNEEDVLGRASGFVPYIGIITILLTDYPAAKYALVIAMSLFVMSAKDGDE